MQKNIAIAAGAIVGFYVLMLFSQMVSNMDKMVDHIGHLSGDVSAMRLSMERMEQHMQRIDVTMYQGSQQMQKANPMNMMDNMIPGNNSSNNRFRPR